MTNSGALFWMTVYILLVWYYPGFWSLHYVGQRRRRRQRMIWALSQLWCRIKKIVSPASDIGDWQVPIPPYGATVVTKTPLAPVCIACTGMYRGRLTEWWSLSPAHKIDVSAEVSTTRLRQCWWLLWTRTWLKLTTWGCYTLCSRGLVLTPSSVYSDLIFLRCYPFVFVFVSLISCMLF